MFWKNRTTVNWKVLCGSWERLASAWENLSHRESAKAKVAHDALMAVAFLNPGTADVAKYAALINNLRDAAREIYYSPKTRRFENASDCDRAIIDDLENASRELDKAESPGD